MPSLKENEYHQSLTDGAKEVLRGKFITINVYIKKKECSQISNLEDRMVETTATKHNIEKKNKTKKQ